MVFILAEQEDLGVAIDYLNEVVEVMGDAAGKISDSLHFMGLLKL